MSPWPSETPSRQWQGRGWWKSNDSPNLEQKKPSTTTQTTELQIPLFTRLNPWLHWLAWETSPFTESSTAFRQKWVTRLLVLPHPRPLFHEAYVAADQGNTDHTHTTLALYSPVQDTTLALYSPVQDRAITIFPSVPVIWSTDTETVDSASSNKQAHSGRHTWYLATCHEVNSKNISVKLRRHISHISMSWIHSSQQKSARTSNNHITNESETGELYFQGSGQEWYISSKLYRRDTPFWSGSLDLFCFIFVLFVYLFFFT